MQLIPAKVSRFKAKVGNAVAGAEASHPYLLGAPAIAGEAASNAAKAGYQATQQAYGAVAPRLKSARAWLQKRQREGEAAALRQAQAEAQRQVLMPKPRPVRLKPNPLLTRTERYSFPLATSNLVGINQYVEAEKQAEAQKARRRKVVKV